MSVTPSAFHSLVASCTASSRTACSALLLALLRSLRALRAAFLGLKQDERVKTDVSFAACMQIMEPSGQQHVARTNLKVWESEEYRLGESAAGTPEVGESEGLHWLTGRRAQRCGHQQDREIRLEERPEVR